MEDGWRGRKYRYNLLEIPAPSFSSLRLCWRLLSSHLICESVSSACAPPSRRSQQYFCLATTAQMFAEEPGGIVEQKLAGKH